MGKLIIAVDFSKASVHALEYAISIANRIKSDIILVWVDKLNPNEEGLGMIVHEQRMEKKELFEELIRKYRRSLKQGQLSYKLRKGKVYQEISAVAKTEKANLIIAGSHGVSGFEEFWIGSNAYRIVSSAPCPVITIRLSYQFKDQISRILLPVDSTPETILKVPFTSQLAAYFQSEIHLLCLYSPGVRVMQRKTDSNAAEVVRMLEKKGIRYHREVIDNEDINRATLNYAEQIEADLISIMTEQESNAANVMLGPYAQQIVNNSPVPVMCVHAREFTMV